MMLYPSSMRLPLAMLPALLALAFQRTEGLKQGLDASPRPRTLASVSRRDVLISGSITAGSSFVAPARKVWASENIAAIEDASGPPERQAFLRAISSKSTDDEVAAAIAALEPLDPSGGKGATSSTLGGTWELIYSINAEAFSPLLNLPAPVRPKSFQLLGDDAAAAVGTGRVAQVLDFPIVPLSFVLSSGTVPYETDSAILEIFPPFRFEVKLGEALRYQIVESGSDADFRALNARDEDAQAAARNLYKQRYLETTGKAGDLRISEVISGDPVIVGSIFVHRRL